MTYMGFTSTSLIAGSLMLALLGPARSEIIIKVDKSAQEMTVLRDGDVLYTWPVSTGRHQLCHALGLLPGFPNGG